MSPDHVQTIQNLVKSSLILSSPEKNEWLDLLDLMNDRQLLELEKILTEAQKNAGANAERTRQDAARSAVGDRTNRAGATGRIGALPLEKPSAAPLPQATQPIAALLKSQPAAPKPASVEESVKATSAFSHILNFPGAAEPEAAGRAANPGTPKPGINKPSVPLPPRAPVIASQTIAKKPASPFLQKLKQMFAEKELPAASAARDLPKPGQTVKISPELLQKTPVKPAAAPTATRHPAAAPKPQEDKKTSPKPAAPVSPKPENVVINVFVNNKEDIAKVPGLAKAEDALRAATAASAPEPAARKPAGALEESAEVVTVKTPPAPIKNKVIIVERPAPPAVTETAAVKESVNLNIPLEENKPASRPLGEGKAPAARQTAEKVTPGLNFTEAPDLEMPKSKIIGTDALVPDNLTLRPAAAGKITLDEKPSDDIKLDSLAAVTGLTANDLRMHATGTLFKKMRNLMGRLGYHEVLFSLEKSALYKAYMNTGIQKLKEDAGADAPAGSRLDQKDFERFADLLIVLQS